MVNDARAIHEEVYRLARSLNAIYGSHGDELYITYPQLSTLLPQMSMRRNKIYYQGCIVESIADIVTKACQYVEQKYGAAEASKIRKTIRDTTVEI